MELLVSESHILSLSGCLSLEQKSQEAQFQNLGEIPHLQREIARDSESVFARYAMYDDTVKSLYKFYDPIVKAESCINLLDNFPSKFTKFMPDFTVQQDGALLHYSLAVWQLLNENYQIHGLGKASLQPGQLALPAWLLLIFTEGNMWNTRSTGHFALVPFNLKEEAPLPFE